jgi:hypothetical protein
LYRFRTLSEQAVFDAHTFSWVSPLLGHVLVKGGIAVEEEDEPLEQMVLVLDIIKFHTGECMTLFAAIIKPLNMSIQSRTWPSREVRSWKACSMSSNSNQSLPKRLPPPWSTSVNPFTRIRRRMR